MPLLPVWPLVLHSDDDNNYSADSGSDTSAYAGTDRSTHQFSNEGSNDDANGGANNGTDNSTHKEFDKGTDEGADVGAFTCTNATHCHEQIRTAHISGKKVQGILKDLKGSNSETDSTYSISDV